MDDKYEQLEAKIDHLQECLYTLMRFVEKEANEAFSKDVEANILADIIFEQIVNPDSFFDGR